MLIWSLNDQKGMIQYWQIYQFYELLSADYMLYMFDGLNVCQWGKSLASTQ